VLAELPRITRRLRGRSAIDRHAIPRLADPYRSLAATVTLASKKAGHRRLLVTSPAPKDGKSTVAAHLALSLAQDGEDTVLLDCDLHHPSQHLAFPDAAPLKLADVIRATNGSLPDSTEIQPRLKLVAATTGEANGTLSVRSPEFLNVIEAASADHEWVVLDSPPVLSTADAGGLARRSDAAILVIAVGRTREDDALAALAALNRMEIPVLGIVLFGVRPRGHSSYYAHRP
jgi:capsular exopolysaccharide synthesis family protein